MTRRPLRRCQSLKPLPFPFSSFARSMALGASASKSKAHMTKSRLRRQKSPGFSGNAHVENVALEGTSEQPTSSDEEDSEGIVQADFAFFDPKDSDFHGVKVLIQNYLDDKQWDLSGFVDLILGQTTVGTVVKIEEDEDDVVYGVVTALNLERYKDHKCLKELKDFLLKVCLGEVNLNNVRPYVTELAQDVGLLISQRVVNLPPQLLPPLYDALFDEISWATEDEPTKELRKSFGFRFYLMISKIYEIKTGVQKKASSNEEAIVYVKPEDEIFHKLSSWSFTFPLRTQQVAPHELPSHHPLVLRDDVRLILSSDQTYKLKDYRPMGLVMAVEASKIPMFRKELHSLIDES